MFTRTKMQIVDPLESQRDCIFFNVCDDTAVCMFLKAKHEMNNPEKLYTKLYSKIKENPQE